MQQPKGFIVSGKEYYVCLLKKSFYGLKQSPRQWYKRFVHIHIYHMQLVQLVDTRQILVKNIGKLFSGCSNTCVALLMFVCILGELEMELLGMSILILQVTLIKEDLLQGKFLLLVFVLSVGKLLCILQLLCVLLRLSTWLLQRLVRKLFSQNDYLVNLVTTCRLPQFFVIVRVLFSSQKIGCLMIEQSTLMYSIILCMISLPCCGQSQHP